MGKLWALSASHLELPLMTRTYDSVCFYMSIGKCPAIVGTDVGHDKSAAVVQHSEGQGTPSLVPSCNHVSARGRTQCIGQKGSLRIRLVRIVTEKISRHRSCACPTRHGGHGIGCL